MRVGSTTVQPVSLRCERAQVICSEVVCGWLKSHPAKPLTWMSQKPGPYTGKSFARSALVIASDLETSRPDSNRKVAGAPVL